MGPLTADFVERTFVQTDEPSWPFGAKSVSEISIDGVAPAIASAIHDATGVWMREVPYTPERVKLALRIHPIAANPKNSL